MNQFAICKNCNKQYTDYSQIPFQGVKSELCSICLSVKYFQKAIIMEHPKRGTKADNAKPDLSLIPTDAMWEMAKAFTYGANKYGRHNFREGIEISRLLAASMRHITQFNEGEDIDEETQCLHLGNAMAGLAMAIFMYKNKPEFDNRWKKIDNSKKE